jgi:hypothetical protein
MSTAGANRQRRILFLGMGRGYSYDCDINFAEPLSRFATVTNYDFYARSATCSLQELNREVLGVVDQVRPEYLLLHTFRHEIFKATLRDLTGAGVTTIMWFSDDHWRFDDYARHFGPFVDFSVTTDHLAIHKYRRAGHEVIQSQWASNERYYKPVDVPQDIDVSFVGARTEPRERLVNDLERQGIRVETFGADWPHGRVSFDEMIRIFSRTRINLNFSASYFGDGIAYPQIKGRVFEIPMCGGLLLTDYADGLESYFEAGKEMLCYRSTSEAADLIRRYLADEEARARIAWAGHIRSIREHTWEARLKALFDEVDRRLRVRTDRETARSRRSQFVVPDVVLKPERPRILELFVNAGHDIVARSSQATEIRIAGSDLGEQVVALAPAEAGVEVERHPIADSAVTPNWGSGLYDIIYLLNIFDRLEGAELEAQLRRCADLLLPDGLVIGMAKLWYATDEEGRLAHRHRGFDAAHRPSQIRERLSAHFPASRLVRVHRPLGPLGPFVAFVAGRHARLRQQDVKTLLAATRQAAADFATTGWRAYVSWSALEHSRGRRLESLDLGARALRARPFAGQSWKAVVRAACGGPAWNAAKRLRRPLQRSTVKDSDE